MLNIYIHIVLFMLLYTTAPNCKIAIFSNAVARYSDNMRVTIDHVNHSRGQCYKTLFRD
jgi:hypothetical protein